MASPITAPARRATKDVFERFGVPVTFTRTVRTGYDPETGEESTLTATVAGRAIRVRGKPDRYERLGLIESRAPTLLFRPDTDGEVPPLDADVEWAGSAHVTADVDPVEPDGEAIIARVIIRRGGSD